MLRATRIVRRAALAGGEIVDRDIVLPARGAQAEQALLDPLQFARIELRRLDRVLQAGTGFVEGDESMVEGGDAGLDEARRLRGAALELAECRREMSGGRALAGDGVEGLVEFAGDLLALLHGGAALGQAGLLAGLRIEGGQFLDGVAQEIDFLAGGLDPGAVLGEGGTGLAHPDPHH